MTTIDECLATVSGDRRTALDRLRKTIRSIPPKAEECGGNQAEAARRLGISRSTLYRKLGASR